MTNTLSSISKKTIALALAMLMVITLIPFTSVSMTAEAKSRATVVDYMRSMATIKWKTNSNITYWNYANDKSESRRFKAGVMYTGMPYTQLNRVNLNQFQSKLKGTEYNGPKGYSSYYGNDCSWSVRCSWNQLGKGVSFSYTGNMFPGSGTGVRAVGSYKSSASTTSTKTITTKSGKSTMYAAYAQLKPGDAIMARHTPSKINHTRLVVSVSGSGENGTVKVIEQCGLSSSRGNTTWNVDKTYTFKQLYSTYYIPITSDALRGANDTEAPPTGPSQLKIEKYNTPPANLGLGKSFSIYGTITSNYNIKSVTVGIYNANGVAVCTKTVSPNSKSFSVSSVDKYVKFATAKAGKNIYRITATDEKTTKKLVEKTYTVGSSNGSTAAASTLSVSGYNYPTELKQGQSFTIEGKISSNYMIKSITVGVYNSKGGSISTKTVSPNAKSYSIANISSYIKFNKAAAGTNYYKIKATDEKQTKTLLNKSFTVTGSNVVSNGKKESDKSTLTITRYNYPTIIKSGDQFMIKGDIMSNYKIISVTVGVYDKNGKAVSKKTVQPKAKTYSIANLVNFVKFKKAQVGTNYYKIDATDEKCTKTLLNKEFTVQAAYPISKLTLTNANYPTVLTKGASYTIKGIVSSNYNIKRIVVGVYTNAGVKISEKTVKPNATSYSLANISKNIKFEDANTGKNIYKVIAQDEKKEVTFINQAFTVVAKNSTASSLTTKYLGIMGDSTLFIYENGDTKKTVIIDTGNSNAAAHKAGEKSFLDKINAFKDNLDKTKSGKYIIDYLFITHGHSDHMDGLYDLLATKQYYIKNFIANNVHINGDRANIKTDIKNAVKNNLINNVAYINANGANQNVDNCDGKWSTLKDNFLHCKIASDFAFTILPAIKVYGADKDIEDVEENEQNNSSMLIKFEYTKKGSETDYVFLGDIFRDAVKDIYESNAYKEVLSTHHTTYLKINHHASRRVTLSTFKGNGLKKYMVQNGLYSTKIKAKSKKDKTAKSKAEEDALRVSPGGYNYYFFLPEDENSTNGYFYTYTISHIHKAFNAIKQCPKKDKDGNIIKGEYQIISELTDENGKIKNETLNLVNYDEKIKTLFAVDEGSILIGIGNVKTRSGRMASDLTTYFAIEGCDQYIDVRDAFKKLDRPSQCTVPVTSCLGDTYTVKK